MSRQKMPNVLEKIKVVDDQEKLITYFGTEFFL